MIKMIACNALLLPYDVTKEWSFNTGREEVGEIWVLDIGGTK